MLQTNFWIELSSFPTKETEKSINNNNSIKEVSKYLSAGILLGHLELTWPISVEHLSPGLEDPFRGPFADFHVNFADAIQLNKISKEIKADIMSRPHYFHPVKPPNTPKHPINSQILQQFRRAPRERNLKSQAVGFKIIHWDVKRKKGLHLENTTLFSSSSPLICINICK